MAWCHTGLLPAAGSQSSGGRPEPRSDNVPKVRPSEAQGQQKILPCDICVKLLAIGRVSVSGFEELKSFWCILKNGGSIEVL